MIAKTHCSSTLLSIDNAVVLSCQIALESSTWRCRHTPLGYLALAPEVCSHGSDVCCLAGLRALSYKAPRVEGGGGSGWVTKQIWQTHRRYD
eukprot:jgi/Botrbrau1/951/Bobra.0167s0058.1